jgi:hypothetical protein
MNVRPRDTLSRLCSRYPDPPSVVVHVRCESESYRQVERSGSRRQQLDRLGRGWPVGQRAVGPEGVPSGRARRVEWGRILKSAEIGKRTLEDLRDTYASQLISDEDDLVSG